MLGSSEKNVLGFGLMDSVDTIAGFWSKGSESILEISRNQTSFAKCFCGSASGKRLVPTSLFSSSEGVDESSYTARIASA